MGSAWLALHEHSWIAISLSLWSQLILQREYKNELPASVGTFLLSNSTGSDLKEQTWWGPVAQTGNFRFFPALSARPHSFYQLKRLNYIHWRRFHHLSLSGIHYRDTKVTVLWYKSSPMIAEHKVRMKSIQHQSKNHSFYLCVAD